MFNKLCIFHLIKYTNNIFTLRGGKSKYFSILFYIFSKINMLEAFLLW